MTQKQLETLIRMAVEIDDLEATAREPMEIAPIEQEPATLRLVNAQSRAIPRHGAWRRTASLIATAAAACIAAAWFWSDANTSVEPPAATPRLAERPLSPRTVIPVAVSPAKTAALGDSYVLLAIFRSADGKCQCRSWRVDRLAPGQTLAQLENGEILDAALRGRCVQEIQRMQVMALAGRPDQLPMQQDQVEPLLECFEQTHAPTNSDHPAAMTVAGSACVPGGLTVRTQYVSVANR